MIPNIKLQNFYVHNYIFSVDFSKQSYHIHNLIEFLIDSGYCYFVTVCIMQKFIAFEIISVTLSCVDMVYMDTESKSVSKATTSTETHIPLQGPSIIESAKG